MGTDKNRDNIREEAEQKEMPLDDVHDLDEDESVSTPCTAGSEETRRYRPQVSAKGCEPVNLKN